MNWKFLLIIAVDEQNAESAAGFVIKVNFLCKKRVIFPRFLYCTR